MQIAAVSYLNTAPLIEGLEAWEGCEMVRAVPAQIAGMVVDGEADLGLVSVVDFAKAGEGGEAGLVMVPAGMIGCDGATLTVRLFSSVPIDEIATVYADTDSHTSVVLCDLVLREAHGVDAKFVDFDVRERVAVGRKEKTPSALRAPPPQVRGRSEDDGDCTGDHFGGWPEAVLMIGDKVVTGSPAAVRYPYQVDLGLAWFEMTGLPFVYATWMCRADRAGDGDIAAAALVLERTMLRNRMRIDWIVMNHAKELGWPTDLAQRYIGELLRFEVDDRAREAVGVFLKKAGGVGLVPRVDPVWMELGCEDGAGA